jgi:hypothetical protein
MFLAGNKPKQQAVLSSPSAREAFPGGFDSAEDFIALGKIYNGLCYDNIVIVVTQYRYQC